MLAQKSKTRYNILIGVPSSGVISEGTGQATYQASLHHDFDRVPSHYSGPNFNRCLKEMFNCGLRGQYTHGALVHADLKVVEDHLFTSSGKPICPTPNNEPSEEICRERSRLWADVMIDDMEALGMPFMSAPIALKDSCGLLSCGAGDPNDPWTVWRRFCVNELPDFPKVFDKHDVGYPDKYLLHSSALCMFDLRNPCWYKHNERGDVPAMFNFSEKIVWSKKDKEYKIFCQSEDWAFSRMLWRANIASAITTNIKVIHLTGNIEFPNWGDWGTYKNGDEDLAFKWRDSPSVPRSVVTL